MDPKCAHQCIVSLEWSNNNEVKSRMTKTIPQFVHQIWLGPITNMTDANHIKCKQWQQFALEKGYLYRLWTLADISYFETQLLLPREREHFQNCLKIGDWWAASDILRYHLLNHHGGFYCDVDFQPATDCDGNLCDILEFTSKTGLVAFSEHDARNLPGTGSYFLMNGMLACPPSHPIIQHVCEHISENIEHWVSKTGSVDASYATGPFFLTRHVNGPFTMVPITFLKQFRMY